MRPYRPYKLVSRFTNIRNHSTKPNANPPHILLSTNALASYVITNIAGQKRCYIKRITNTLSIILIAAWLAAFSNWLTVPIPVEAIIKQILNTPTALTIPLVLITGTIITTLIAAWKKPTRNPAKLPTLYATIAAPFLMTAPLSAWPYIALYGLTLITLTGLTSGLTYRHKKVKNMLI